jgi:RNA polymerase sigma factor (sigma-70 family)
MVIGRDAIAIAIDAPSNAETTGPEGRLASDDELVNEYLHLRGIAHLLCRGPAQAEDLAAEAMTRVLRRKRRGDIERLRPYLRRTLINLVMREREKSAAEMTASVRGWSRPSIEEPGEVVASRSEMSKALEALTLDQRVVVVLRFYEDMSPPQVAALLGVPVGTVESRTSRATAKLRTFLVGGTSDG